MMPEIVRFWASIAQSNAERQRYEIHGVMGPDQFHEKSQSLSRRGDHADVRRYSLPRFTDSVGVHGTGAGVDRDRGRPGRWPAGPARAEGGAGVPRLTGAEVRDKAASPGQPDELAEAVSFVPAPSLTGQPVAAVAGDADLVAPGRIRRTAPAGRRT